VIAAFLHSDRRPGERRLWRCSCCRRSGSRARRGLLHEVAPTFTLEAGLPLVVADRSQIQQLIMNLVVNGVESTGRRQAPSGSARARSSSARWTRAGSFVRSEVAPGAYVELEVTDTGSGMSAAAQARIFDPFFTTKFTGRGLGLAAVHGIVQGQRPRSPLRRCPPPASLFDSSEALERRLRCRMAELSRTALHAAAWRAVARDRSIVSGIATVAGALP
jgi:hypothetical protein